MPPDTIARREDALLVVIDEQERLAAAMPRRASVLRATTRLVRCAVLLGVPIVVTRQYPKGLGDVEPELAEAVSRAARGGASVTFVDKVAFDCFNEPAFAETVLRSGRGQLVVAGMESHICVTQTALSAVRRSFDVHVVADACCSRDEGNHALALDRMRAAGAVITAAESVMYELLGEAGTDEFRVLLAIVKE